MINNDYSIIDNGLYKDYDYLEGIIDYTLEHEKVENAIFSIIFVTDEEIHKMNREYRGVDRITDVISFAFEDNQNIVYNNVRMLGDIYICISQMKRQAEEYKHSEKRELSFLVVHGLLHLLGYDHMEPEDEKIMFDLQELILNGKDIKR
ncbi:MAG: rRNA maturation RNase YbeY [Bacilli bacterium]|nr:rRNA maturation RNase YbeY [Bacilli bacterium]